MTTDLTIAELADWLATQTWSDFAQSLAADFARKGTLSPKQEAAARSMHAKVSARNAARAESAPAPTGPIPMGLHVAQDGTVMRVLNTRNTGQMIAKALVRDAYGDFSWEYRGKRGLRGLSADTAMTAAQATEWGLNTGQCVNCFADLTDPRSEAVAYGPVCAKNHGWFYPSMEEAQRILDDRRAAAEV